MLAINYKPFGSVLEKILVGVMSTLVQFMEFSTLLRRC